MSKHSLQLAALFSALALGGIAHAAPAPPTGEIAITDAAGQPFFPPTRIEYNALMGQTQDNLQNQILAK